MFSEPLLKPSFSGHVSTPIHFYYVFSHVVLLLDNKKSDNFKLLHYRCYLAPPPPILAKLAIHVYIVVFLPGVEELLYIRLFPIVGCLPHVSYLRCVLSNYHFTQTKF